MGADLITNFDVLDKIVPFLGPRAYLGFLQTSEWHHGAFDTPHYHKAVLEGVVPGLALVPLDAVLGVDMKRALLRYEELGEPDVEALYARDDALPRPPRGGRDWLFACYQHATYARCAAMRPGFGFTYVPSIPWDYVRRALAGEDLGKAGHHTSSRAATIASGYFLARRQSSFQFVTTAWRVYRELPTLDHYLEGVMRAGAVVDEQGLLKIIGLGLEKALSAYTKGGARRPTPELRDKARGVWNTLLTSHVLDKTSVGYLTESSARIAAAFF